MVLPLVHWWWWWCCLFLCKCTTVRWSTMQVAGRWWWRRWTMKTTFNCSGGGCIQWRRQHSTATAVGATDRRWWGDHGNWHQRWRVVTAGVSVWQRWWAKKVGVGIWRWPWMAAVAAVDDRDGIQWRRWQWCSMAAAAFDGVWWCWWWTTTRGREGGARAGNANEGAVLQEDNKRWWRDNQLARQDNERWHNKTTRRWEGGTLKGDATTSRRDKRMRGWHGVQWGLEERQCDNKLVRRVDGCCCLSGLSWGWLSIANPTRSICEWTRKAWWSVKVDGSDS